jgi:hypothetical protein
MADEQRTDREAGFYWVRDATDAYDGWMPARWDGTHWWLLGWECPEFQVDEVGPRCADFLP